MNTTFEIYRDKKGEWRWKLIGDDKKIIAVSGTSFALLDDCTKAIKEFNSLVQNTPAPISDEQEPEKNMSATTDEYSVRVAKLLELQNSNVDCFPARAKTDMQIGDLLHNFDEYAQSEKNVALAGRLMAKRMQGKTSFASIRDVSGKVQVYIRFDVVGEEMFSFYKKFVDIGDFIAVRGTAFTTQTGEQTLKVTALELISKALRPLPEKFHGLTDEFKKIKLRYIELTTDDTTRERFILRTRLVSKMRETLDAEGYIEVETPTLQSLYGGANARPFETFHNALDMKLYMRIATELYLKRLIVGGLDRVYEIGKNFRNEGIDRMHNPEFTLVEMYCAYADYTDMMALAEKLLRTMAKLISPECKITYQGIETDLAKPFAKVRYIDAISSACGFDVREKNVAELETFLREQKIEFKPFLQKHQLVDELFKEKVERFLIEPTFVVDYPVEISPLAKRSAVDTTLVERFELFWYGMEIANAFSELNDPQDQRRRFESQMEFRAKGDPDAQILDEDYIEALEHGMPPTGGMGMGVDRLAMVFTDSYSIRDIILFPLLRVTKA